MTTPQPAAQKVAQRAAFMAEKVSLDVKGVIENMSWFTGDDGTRYEIFGSGGGQELAETIDVPLLGRIPLVPKLREGGDDGHPIMAVDPSSEAAAGVRRDRRARRRGAGPDPPLQPASSRSSDPTGASLAADRARHDPGRGRMAGCCTAHRRRGTPSSPTPSWRASSGCWRCCSSGTLHPGGPSRRGWRPRCGGPACSARSGWPWVWCRSGGRSRLCRCRWCTASCAPGASTA